MDRKLWYVKGCDLFSTLTPEQAERLDRHAYIRTYKRHSLIYSPTEPGESILVLTKGKVKIKDITPDGKETILAFIEEGEIFGELAILEEDTRQEYAEAAEDSEIVLVPRENFLWLMTVHKEVALYITKLIGWRRKRIENRLRNVLFLPSRDRMVRLLLELAENHGDWEDLRCEIRLRLTHQELASLIGVTRETVTATLGQLQEEGIIDHQRRRITILNARKLQAERNGSHEPDEQESIQVVSPKKRRKM